MAKQWPVNENYLSWDPENMQRYWELAAAYDQYPQRQLETSDALSATGFNSMAANTNTISKTCEVSTAGLNDLF